MSNCLSVKISILSFELWISFELWALNFDISFGWGLGIVLIEIVACFFVILQRAGL